MSRPLTPAVLGAMVRDARMAAGLSQTALGDRIGASRFWVAAFEKGKPSAELGLALKALQALGLTVRVDAPASAEAPIAAPMSSAHPDVIPTIDLGTIIAAASKPVPVGRSRSGKALEWPSITRVGAISRER
jgi:HTH-type transcriptional regulator/antitoxin HipB